MSTIMDFRVREEMAGAVLKEVAALEPSERLQEAHSLTQMMGQAVQALEELWEELREPLQGGISPLRRRGPRTDPDQVCQSHWQRSEAPRGGESLARRIQENQYGSP